MRLFITIGSLSLLLAAAGCRRDPALQVYIDQMNAEKRMLENRLNELQFELEAKERELERYRRRAGEKTSELDRSDRSRPVPQLELPAPRRDRDEREEEPDVPDLDLSPPMIEPGEKTGDQRRSSTSVASTRTSGQAKGIVRLAIDRKRTGGVDRDALPGHDAMRVVLQTLDADGNYQPIPAPIELELLERGNGTSVAVWRFTKEEVELEMAHADAIEGLTLGVSLPKRPRATRQYRLIVRYLGPAGKIEADMPIELEPNAQRTSRWTPRRDGAGEPEARIGEQVETPTEPAHPTAPNASRWQPLR